ncbi:uncharacterized protein [Panulirus ornatus]|uniref:uncharacterized protein isoform X2 n=1 Tax=Panulirus ornatus TaxID=150431 RepID=UPI003A8B5248
MSSPNSAEVSGSPSPAPSSIGNNAPKYGTLVPNRVFVGGISASTTEQDLLELFSQYGTVKATKIISDRAGVSKGYGFVTFETEEEARRLTQEADDIMLKDRKLNIAPAIKKQVSDVGYLKTYSPRLIESSGSVVGTSGTVFFGNGAAYTTYGNTMPVMAPAEYHPTFPQAPAAPTTPSTYPTIVYPQPLYYPQQYQYQPTTVQPQWGVAPQWRWITPASYPQPECSPQQCLVEPSSPAQGDLTAASAMGSPLLISTPLTLACPSTPTTAITTTSTTTVCTTVTITSTSSTKTTATTTSTSTKMLRTHDSLLQIKPLSVAGKTTPASGKSKYNPTVTPKTTLAVDKNNNSAEGSKVGGGNGDSTPPSTQQTSRRGTYVHGYPSSSTSSSTVAFTNNTVYNNWPSTHSKTTKNSGLTDHKKKGQEVGSQKGMQDQESNRQMNQTPKQSGSPSVSNQPFHVAGCCMEMMTNSNSIQSKVAGTGDWNGWIPMAALGKGLGWGSHPGSSSLCPHHGAVAALPGNPATQQPPRRLMSPSWASLGWTPTPPHSHSFNSRNTTANNNNKEALLLPHLSYSPHSESLTHGGIQVQQFSQAPQSPVHPQMFETVPKASHTSTSTVQPKDTVSCSTVVTNSSNSTSAITISTSSSKTNSSSNSPTQAVNGTSNHCLTLFPGNGTEQTMYGFTNQQPLVVMPYCQYGGTVAPYYHWAAPFIMQWPLTPSVSMTHSTPAQTTTTTTVAPPKVSEAIHSYTDLPFTRQNSEDSVCQTPQIVTSRCTVGAVTPSSSSSPSLEPTGSVCVNKKKPNEGLSVHTLTCVSSDTLCENPSEQIKPDVYSVSVSDSPCKLSSLHQETAHKLPQPLTPSSPHHAAPARQYFGPPTEVGARKLPPLHDDGCATMPMTPPPTPLLETDNLTVAVNNSALS